MAWSRSTVAPFGPSWKTAPPAQALPHVDRRFVDGWKLEAEHRSQGGSPPLPPSLYRLPGEFERQGTIFLGCGELASFYPEILADVVEAVRHRVDVAALVPDAEGRKTVIEILSGRGLPSNAVHYLEVPHDTMWVRDYGPLFVRRNADGQAMVVDADYERFSRPKDDDAPQVLASQLRLPAVRAPLTLEGGNLLSNGRGVCLTTTTLLERNRERGYSEDQVRNLLRSFFGAHETLFLEPLSGESTGHVDMFAVFTSPQTVIVGQYDLRVDPINAAILDRNAARIGQLRGPKGPLTVVRIPMPPRQGDHWRTYTNVVFANGLLLTPVYGRLDPHGERTAVETYRRLLPGWRIAGIDVSGLIVNGGALHCISMNAPRLVRWPSLPPAPRAAEPPVGPVAAKAWSVPRS